MNHWIRRDAAKNSLKTIIVAAALSALSGYAQAENLKPLQGISFHTVTKDAVAYYVADNGTCKAVVTITDKTHYAPARFEAKIEARAAVVHPIEEGKALELACHTDAQEMSINLVMTVAQK